LVSDPLTYGTFDAGSLPGQHTVYATISYFNANVNQKFLLSVKCFTVVKKEEYCFALDIGHV
jgi:hypothetical protein